VYAEPKGRSTVLPGGRTDKTSIVQCMTVHVLCCAVLRCAVIDERQVCVAMYAEAKGPGTVLPGGRTDKTSIVQCMTVHVFCCAVLCCD